MKDNELYDSAFDKELRILARQFEEAQRTNARMFIDEETMEELFEYFYQQDQNQMASKLLDQAIEMYPANGYFWLRKAQLACLSGNYTKAEFFLNKAEGLDPSNFEVYLLRGTIFDANDNYSEAIKVLRKAEQLAEDAVDMVYNALGNVFMNWDKPNTAIYYFQKFLQINPQHEDTLINISYCYQLLEDHVGAEQFFKNYIDKYPYTDVAWYGYGVALQKQDRLDDALTAFDYVILINSDNTLGWLSLANTFLLKEQYADALNGFNKALELFPDNPMTMCGMGLCLEKMEKFEEARTWYFKAIEADPGIHDAWFGLGMVALLTENYAQCITYFQKALNLYPDNPETFFSLGEAYHLSDQTAEAITAYEKALALDPTYLEARFELAELLLPTDSHAALTLVKEAKVDPDEETLFLYQSAAFYILHGWEQMGLTQLEKALITDTSQYFELFNFAPSLQQNEKVLILIHQYIN